MDQKFSILPKIINGSVAGIVGVTCVFPIDLVKTRLQNQQIGPNGQRMYSSMLDCAVKTFRNEGFFGMYRGSAVNLLLITPEKAIKLVGNDIFRHALKTKEGRLTLPREMLAGGGAGMCQITVTTPMELLKIQLQDAGRTAGKIAQSATTSAAAPAPLLRTYSGSTTTAATASPKATAKPSATRIALKLVREKGILGLYRGMGATFLRDVTFSAIYFPLFAHLNSLGKKREGSDTSVFYVSLLAGIGAGAVASVSVNPFDVVKTRLQTLNKAQGEQSYTGIMDCFVKTWKSEGTSAFFKGGTCRMMVIAPLFGIAQMVYYMGVGEMILGVPRN